MRGDFASSLFLFARKEEILILNQFVLNVDLKRHYCSETPTFRRGDNVELLFVFYDDGDEYSINSATKAEVYQKTSNGNIIVADCEFVNHQGKRVVRWQVEDVSMVELGYLNLKVVVYEGNDPISIQPFNILILDDYMGGAGSFIELIQELQKLIENMVIDLNNAIKLTEKGVPNGVATLDKDGKIPLIQLPKEFEAFLEHIDHTVFEHHVHGLKLDDDGLLMYLDNNNNWQYVGFSDTGVGGSSLLHAEIEVKNGIATITYTGVPTVNTSKWTTGDHPTTYFLLSGTTFTGTTFPVSSLGIHTLYYKDSNGVEYVKTFNVTSEMLGKPNVDIDVDDGYVTVTIPPSTTTSIKKWAKGTRDVAYFAYNGTTFTGNSFQVAEVGIYTIYIKTSTGLEYVYVFEVTEDMLQAGNPIKDLPYGSIIKFNNEDWLLLEPDTGYIAKATPLVDLMPYDTKRESSGTTVVFGNTYNPTSSTNIGHYLNNTYYNTISSKFKTMVLSSKFSKVAISETDANTKPISSLKSTEMTSTVTTKVGMLSISDWKKHSKYYNTSGALSYPSYEIWLLNGVNPSGGNSWWITNGTNQAFRPVTGVGEYPAAFTVPTLYLSDSTRVKPNGDIQ